MKNEPEVINQLGYCGLWCGGCFAYSQGAIRSHAKALQDALGNFGPYARRFVGLLNEPRFEDYDTFASFLGLLTEGKCNGCRVEQCKLYDGCKVKDCVKEKGVDFCFQCSSFPCSDTGFDENLHKRWIDINKRISETGAEQYLKEISSRPRY